MKKFTSTTFAATAHNPRTAARLILAFVASVLVVLLATMGMSSGPGGAMAFAQDPTPTETEPPSTDPAIQLINPSPLNVGFPVEDRPAVSDDNDGVDELYHLVAWTANTPANAVVEAYYTPTTAAGIPLPEVTIGQLFPVEGAPDTWEYFWDIPGSINDGDGEITVRLFTDTVLGTEEVANDTVEVTMENKDDDPPPTGDGNFVAGTVELTWPSQNGELGFYKPRGGSWRTIVDVSRSATFYGSYIYYTKSAPGQEPEWVLCSAAGTTAARIQCTLADGDLPSEVNAIHVLLEEVQDICCFAFTTESSDTHRVRPYAVTPEQMRLELSPADTADTGGTYRQVVGNDPDTGEPHSCIALLAQVFDNLDREVLGANIDVHATGPNDQLQFGDEDRMFFSAGATVTVEPGQSPEYKNPDKGSHQTESGENCDRVPENETQSHAEKPIEGTQGDHNVPGGADIKHRESGAAGSGLSGGNPSGFGAWNFHVFSPDVGTTEVTAWIDDEPTAESETRPADSDTPENDEASASATLQWLPGDITVRFNPPGDTAQVGTCNRYVVEVRGGNVPVRGINLDIHATGPTNELDFCDPGDGTPRRAPNNTGNDEEHEAEDEGEAHHRGDPPQTQHTEGETDDAGNFVIGITSPVTGDTVLEAWVDGEKGADNDVPGSGEATGRATKSWAASLAEAQVSFVNPSAYGGSGTNVSNKPDANQSFHIVTRVDSFETPGVEILISDDDGATFAKIGDADRVGGTDTWEMFWGANVPDGDYILRAQITGTNRVEDQTITVNNEDGTDDDPTDEAFETLELSKPTNGDGVAFTNRETPVEGVASADTDWVDLFYTKVAAKDTPQEADWISCGSVEPAADNSFQGSCELQGSDQASSVTGIAALTFDCSGAVCDPDPAADVRGPGSNDSGDAHRVFGFEGRPRIGLEPRESAAKPGDCQRLVLSVEDETGQAIAGQNVDVHLTGPDNEAHFCTPDTGGTARRAPDQGGHSAGQPDEGVHGGSPDTKHTEGETNSSGRFVFGVTSPVKGDSQVQGWVDQNDNDADDGEPAASAVVHWGQTSGGGGDGRGCTITGTSGPDRLIGTDGDDVICGKGGKDEIRGGGGNDIIYGDRGHDDIRGNAGNDIMYGNRGIDIIRGGRGNDVARGGKQDDTIRGYIGRDKLVGGGGNDTLRAGAGRDTLKGGSGDDLMDGGRGVDTCRGGRGRDRSIRCER